MTTDREVLEFIGQQGKTPAQLAERFTDFDVERLVRAALVRLHRIEMPETVAHGGLSTADQSWYVLTTRGAGAIGLDPHTLHAA